MNIFKEKARQLYPSLILSEFSQLQYASFLNLILETEEGAVLWHCSQGKDRTGIGAALILGALGADKETIIEDFAHSNDIYRPVVEKFIAEVEAAGGGEEEKEVVRAFMGVSVRNFRHALDIIDANWGSIPQYLDEQMGIDENDLKTLRDRYLQ
jgi:protein-tyrosine phosphatase